MTFEENGTSAVRDEDGDMVTALIKSGDLFTGIRPGRISLTVVGGGPDVKIRRRRRRRNRHQTIAMKLPPRLVIEEQSVVMANYLLAYGYVAKYGDRFEAVIPRDDQVSECFLKLCSVLDGSRASSFNPDKGYMISTFAYRVFFNHLVSIAMRESRFVPSQMSVLVDFDVPAPEVDEDESDEEEGYT